MGKYKSKFNGNQIDDGIEYGVRVTPQTFDNTQKQRARENIGAQETLSVGTNLDNTPTDNSTNPVTSGAVSKAISVFNISSPHTSLIDGSTIKQVPFVSAGHAIILKDGTVSTTDSAAQYFTVSDYIEISMSEEYCYCVDDKKNNGYGEINFYDSNKTLLCTLKAGSGNNLKKDVLSHLVMPPYTKYIKYALKNASVGNSKYGLFKVTQSPYMKDFENRFNLESYKDRLFMGIHPGRNKFSYDYVLSSTYMKSDGTLAAYADFGVIVIPILSGETLYINVSNNFYDALLDDKFNVISGTVIQGTAMQITNNVNASYAAFTIYNLSRNDFIIQNTPINNATEYIAHNKLGAYIEDDLYIKADYHVASQMTLVETTFTDGIFDQGQTQYFETSDYIQLVRNENTTYYLSWKTTMAQNYTLARFYDENRVMIAEIKGSSTSKPKTDKVKYKLSIPKNAKYIRFSNAKNERTSSGLWIAQSSSLDDVLNEFVLTKKSNKKVLWLGTSITASCTYAQNSCKNLGFECINKGVGASSLCIFWDNFEPVTECSDYEGLCTSATVSEIEAKFRPAVTAGNLTEDRLSYWKQCSYENILLPYLDEVDAVIIDHGYNDRESCLDIYNNGEQNINWNSVDRTNFVGAINYILQQIWSRKPFMKVIIGGYFQNTMNLSGRNGKAICEVLTYIAKHYSIPLLDVWNYCRMGGVYIQGTSNYLTEFNSQYGTSYNNQWPDANGNLLAYQLCCPDGVHPFSDLTGNSNKILDAIFTKLLENLI